MIPADFRCPPASALGAEGGILHRDRRAARGDTAAFLFFAKLFDFK
jgi:hypothetical protein